MDRYWSESSAPRGDELIRVTDTNAKSTEIRRGQIQQIRPSGTSIMPVGLAAMLGDAAIRDLIAFSDGRSVGWVTHPSQKEKGEATARWSWQSAV